MIPPVDHLSIEIQLAKKRMRDSIPVGRASHRTTINLGIKKMKRELACLAASRKTEKESFT